MLSPSESIVENVKKLKEFSFNTVGEYESHHSRAHITVQFWSRKKPVWVEPLMPKLERDLQTLSPIVLDTNDFGFFDHNDHKTIYAKLGSTSLTKFWFKNLRKYFNRADFEPHITIAKNIPSDAFAKLWPRFKNFEWREQFVVDKLTVLKKETIGYNKNYKVFKEIPFNKKLDFYEFANSKSHKAAPSFKTADTRQACLF